MVSQNIKFIRKFLGKNQVEFGRMFDLTRGMIDSYERSLSTPSLTALKKIAQHFNITLVDLTEKDISLTPGILVNDDQKKNLKEDELLKAKDDLINSLREQIKLQQAVIESLQKKE